MKIMAKKIMPKTRLVKTNVTHCGFCDLEERYERAYDAFIQKAKEQNIAPDKEFMPWWRAESRAVPGIPGYKVATFRTSTKEDWRTDDGLTEMRTTYICEDCMNVLNKCFSNLGDGVENSYARKEAKVLPMPEIEEVIVEEE